MQPSRKDLENLYVSGLRRSKIRREASLLWTVVVLAALVAAEWTFGGVLTLSGVAFDAKFSVFGQRFLGLLVASYGTIVISRLYCAHRGKDLYARLADRNKAPRSWWFPAENSPPAISVERATVLHDSVSSTIRNTLLLLLSFAFFSLLTVAGHSDASLLQTEQTINVPFADTRVSFTAFVILSPLMMIVITYYLHTYVSELTKLKAAVGEQATPDIFNLASAHARVITWLLFYAITPVTILVVTWRALALRNAAALLLALLSIATICGLLLLAIRRTPTKSRQKNTYTVLWLSLFLLPLQLIQLGWLDGRPYNLTSANLVNAQLEKSNLGGADFTNAKLTNAVLTEAILRDTKLYRTDMTGANLSGADLTGAVLVEIDLRDSTLSEAVFKGACGSNVEWGAWGPDAGFTDCPPPDAIAFNAAILVFTLGFLWGSVFRLRVFWKSVTSAH